MHIPEYVDVLLKRLENNGFEAYVVGGCVRDLLMGEEPRDYDVTTNALPKEIKECFPDLKTILTGEKHGTVCVVSGGENVEITTYRVDGEYKDGRHPERVNFTASLEEDLSRRDFTVNAIAYSPRGGLTDPFDGQADIQNKIVRCVGEPEKRFSEDALRIMRAVRFAAVLGFEIDSETKTAIHRQKALLNKISVERIFSELSKLLCGESAGEVLCEFSDVICTVIPELEPSVNFDQKNIHHCYDVYTHTAHVVKNCPKDLPLRLAALFHDCGKPGCYFMGEDEQGHFYGHAAKSRDMADKALTRLRCSNSLKHLVCELVAVHDREVVNTKKAIRRFLSAVSEEVARRIFDLKKADNLSLAPAYRSRVSGLAQTEALMRQVMENNECVSERSLEIDGNDLINLGLSQGKRLGCIKKQILSAVIDGEVENEKEKLLLYAKKLIQTAE